MNFDTLVLSGGGSKGIFQLGALYYYEECGKFDVTKIKIFSGTSVGSIICALLACEFTAFELFKEMYQMESILGTIDPRNIFDMIRNYGFLSIESVAKTAEMLILKKYTRVPTFAELFENGKFLRIPGSNVTTMKGDYFTPYSTPNVDILTAIKISCNIPIVFEKYDWRSRCYVDGGMVDNVPFPIIEGRNVLCVVIKGHYVGPVESFIDYFLRLVMLPINTITDMTCKFYENRPNVTIVGATVSSVSPLNFSLSEEQKTKLFMDGYKTAKMVDTSVSLEVKGATLLIPSRFSFRESIPSEGWEVDW